MRPTLFCLSIGLALVGAANLAAAPNTDAVDAETNSLIDALVDVSEPGLGYGATFAGSEFLPYAGSGHPSMGIIGAMHATRSDTLRKLVERGVAAVPTLLQHLDDRRPTHLPPSRGMMWIDFPDEYDFNARTRKEKPEGVNRERTLLNEPHPDEHTVTVGDLCFVALGQIVNRTYNATRYQPTGGLVVNSPTYSERLRQAAVDEWKGLTPEKHRASLVDDFRRPDFDGRLNGAYLRLAYYYPATVEELVLAELAAPTYDVTAVYNFLHDVLYRTPAGPERLTKFDQFVKRHGEHYVAAVQDFLFQDLDRLEANEEGRLHPPLTEFGTQPRELLIELFNKPKNVKAADRPQFVVMSSGERAGFIERLIHDDRPKIGEAVVRLFLANIDDEYFSQCCLRSLASRGYGPFILTQLWSVDLARYDERYALWIEALSEAKSPAVRRRLVEIAVTTRVERFFLEAPPAFPRPDDSRILSAAKRLLPMLPVGQAEEESYAPGGAGEGLLSIVRQNFPDEAKPMLREYLAKNDLERAETVCRVLWHGDPWAPEILGPMLDDKRELQGFAKPMRLCDRAAQAVSHFARESDPEGDREGWSLRYDSDWPLEQRDARIEVLKEFCRKQIAKKDR